MTTTREFIESALQSLGEALHMAKQRDELGIDYEVARGLAVGLDMAAANLRDAIMETGETDAQRLSRHIATLEHRMAQEAKRGIHRLSDEEALAKLKADLARTQQGGAA